MTFVAHGVDFNQFLGQRPYLWAIFAAIYWANILEKGPYQ